jgi:hypothetical protein
VAGNVHTYWLKWHVELVEIAIIIFGCIENEKKQLHFSKTKILVALMMPINF